MTYGNASGQAEPPGEIGQPDPYGQPRYPQRAGRRTNSLAIASLCCGIGQVLAGAIAGIVAIVLGLVALRQIKETGEDGRGMAVAGIVLGIVGIMLTALLVILLLAVIRSASS
jgi:Domain of unknown function (DUF4190)